MLASPNMLQLLSTACHWYMDGMFKVVGKPFTQLYSIHMFVKADDDSVKQLPLLFILMNRRRWWITAPFFVNY